MNWVQIITTVISVVALAASLFSLWQTNWRRGVLHMTRPSLLFMAREGPRNEPKFFLRALLFSTAIRGWIVEQLYLRVTNQAGIFQFGTWAYGEREKLLHGSGLFVGQQGVVHNHHFVPRPGTVNDFNFYDGDYRVEVFATVFGRTAPRKISEFDLVLSSQHAAELIQILDMAVFFEWDAEQQKYVSRTERQLGRFN